MKVVVCVKPVKGELTPFDESALERALQIEGAEVTVVSMAPPSAKTLLERLTRLEISGAVLLSDPAFAGADTLATSYALSMAMRRLCPDLILCGRQSTDGDTAQTGPCLAQLLDLPLIPSVLEIRRAGAAVLCAVRSGTKEEEVTPPALLIPERTVPLRFASIRAKTRPVAVWNAGDIGADPAQCGLRGSPTRVLQTYECAAGRRRCEWIAPDELPGVIARERSRTRVRAAPAPSADKMRHIWVIGEELEPIARSVAHRVTVLPRQSPEAVAALAGEQRPAAILWPADPWGRNAAPRAAAILQTGLCADCTHLEADGEKLLLYRPARGGSLTAKIECRTLPQMATVRVLPIAREEMVVAAGRGATKALALLKAFAAEHGAAFGASRGLVDLGEAAYETQIGLTGKSVSPKIYLACGISGSVQHTCAIEQAGIVIAVNPDPEARIFEYADYGILARAEDVFGLSRETPGKPSAIEADTVKRTSG